MIVVFLYICILFLICIFLIAPSRLSHRIEKVNELIKQELGKIIFAEEDFGQGVLVTVLAANCSPDLRQAAVIISVLPTEKGKTVLEKLSRHLFPLQQLLNKKLEMRPVPKIRFVLSADEAESQKVETLLGEITESKENPEP